MNLFIENAQLIAVAAPDTARDRIVISTRSLAPIVTALAAPRPGSRAPLRGRVLSREKLIDAGWGPETIITDRVVDTHILNLRKKLEPKPAKPRFILSVRGMGYRFEGGSS